MPEAEIEAVWRRATVFAMPSLTEGFGLVFIEAMRRGLPVIASRADAGREVNVDGETGFTLDRDDEGALVDALVALLRDPRPRRRARRGGRGALARAVLLLRVRAPAQCRAGGVSGLRGFSAISYAKDLTRGETQRAPDDPRHGCSDKRQI